MGSLARTSRVPARIRLPGLSLWRSAPSSRCYGPASGPPEPMDPLWTELVLPPPPTHEARDLTVKDGAGAAGTVGRSRTTGS